ncbi:Transferrin receptor and related proteins containing the protease-associated (PA) domain [Phaffia rhodozyma]|uniref:Peptide hydrolase n=1 Tax=Phaffia rhodozyma TaxID=264483 RepID=A0A0F7SIQ9_PHARH|nr:Transferrin receptor and related proteins containing the protease-associated (PA) domain [Phaffia rhodozyma]
MYTHTLLPILACSSLLAAALPLSLNVDQKPQQAILGGLSDDRFSVQLAQYEGKVPGFDLDLNDLRLVQFGADERPVWMTEREKIIAKSKGRRFMDITETPSLGSPSLISGASAPKTFKYPTPNSTLVSPILKHLSVDEPKKNLVDFTSFYTRYYRSDTGKQSSEWLLAKVEQYIADAPKEVREHVSVQAFPHTWAQTSVIATFTPKNKENRKAPVTVVGAHCDSTNMLPFLRSPGADDDGSGTATTLEAFRALVASGYIPETPLQFMWFSAEEGGLLGSQAISQKLAADGVAVKAMIQMDMTAWVKQGTEEVVGIITDFVDPDLTAFNKAIVDRYLNIPWKETKCGYACSDHASFSKAGFQSSFTIESTFENSNKNIHSANDKFDHPEFSFTHMLEFSKLAVGFAVELTQ